MSSAAVLQYYEVRVRLDHKRIVSRHYQCKNAQKAEDIGKKLGHVISVSKVSSEDVIGVLNVRDILANNPPRPGSFRIADNTTLDDIMFKK